MSVDPSGELGLQVAQVTGLARFHQDDIHALVGFIAIGVLKDQAVRLTRYDTLDPEHALRVGKDALLVVVEPCLAAAILEDDLGLECRTWVVSQKN